jgi:hypothetical protein
MHRFALPRRSASLAIDDGNTRSRSTQRTNGPSLYHRLRTHLTAAGATAGDFEFLTGQLARLIIESDNPFTPWQKTAQLKLISERFALRDFHLVVDRGALVSLAFADSPTKH